MFTVNRAALAAELTILQSAAELKTTIPVLACVLMEMGERLQLTVTDCMTTAHSEIAAVGEPWSGCVPLKPLSALVRLFGDEDEVKLIPKTNGRVEVRWGESKHLLPTFAANEFPVLDQVGESQQFEVNGDALRVGLKRVLPSVSAEEGRWQMQGVNFEWGAGLLRLVSTMGHCLSVAELAVDSDAELKVLVPTVAANALLRLDGDAAINVAANHVSIACGSRVVISSLLAGTFPSWEAMIPINPHHVEFNAAQMLTALKRVAVTREERYKVGVGTLLSGVRLDFFNDRIKITTNVNDKGESEELVAATSNLNGDSIAMGMNPDYLTDFLSQAETVRCEIKDSGSQILLIAVGDTSFRHVIVPMRL